MARQRNAAWRGGSHRKELIEMKKIFLSSLVLTTAACSGGGDQAGYGTNTDDLYDTWLVTSAVASGAEMPSEVTSDMRLVMTDTDYEVTVGGMIDIGDLAIDAAASPPRMDMTGTSGPNAGNHMKAIYRQESETLIISYDVTGESYPEDFKSQPGRTDFVVTYRRME